MRDDHLRVGYIERCGSRVGHRLATEARVQPLEAPRRGFVTRLHRGEQRFGLLLVLFRGGAIGKRIGAIHVDASLGSHVLWHALVGRRAALVTRISGGKGISLSSTSCIAAERPS